MTAPSVVISAIVVFAVVSFGLTKWFNLHPLVVGGVNILIYRQALLQNLRKLAPMDHLIMGVGLAVVLFVAFSLYEPPLPRNRKK